MKRKEKHWSPNGRDTCLYFYCLKQHTHKMDNKCVQSGSAAWPRCTGSRHTTTAMYREARLPGPDALGTDTQPEQCQPGTGRRDSGAGCGLRQFSAPLCGFGNSSNNDDAIKVPQQACVYHLKLLQHVQGSEPNLFVLEAVSRGTSGQVYTSVLSPVFLTSYFNGSNCLLW